MSTSENFLAEVQWMEKNSKHCLGAHVRNAGLVFCSLKIRKEETVAKIKVTCSPSSSLYLRLADSLFE